MSITEDAPVRPLAPPRPDTSSPTTVAWWWLVAASILVLALAAVTLLVWWGRTVETRTTSYRVLGDLAGVRLDLADADVEITGGGTALDVRQTERFAFGQPPQESHRVENGTLTIVSRCPDQVLGSCKASYKLTVPDNVPLDIETAHGTVHLDGVRASLQVNTGSGDIDATGYCGFSLSASSDSGNVDVVSECSADRLELRSRSGDVNATVPAGRYAVQAQSDTGEVRTRGLDNVEDAGFEIQAESTSGDVSLEAAS